MADRLVAREDGLWDSVREVAEAAANSTEAPAGFVRQEMQVGSEQVEVFARLDDGRAAGPALVVVIAAREEVAPSPAELRQRFGLTRREAEVALLLAARRSNREIAEELYIAESTAWGHTERVLAKLNTGSRRSVGGIIGVNDSEAPRHSGADGMRSTGSRGGDGLACAS